MFPQLMSTLRKLTSGKLSLSSGRSYAEVGDQRKVVRGPARPGKQGAVDFLQYNIPANIDGIQGPDRSPGRKRPKATRRPTESLWREPLLSERSPEVVEVACQYYGRFGVAGSERVAREES